MPVTSKTSLLLIGDRRFLRRGSYIYTEGPRGPETGERYLRWFDEVTVIGRRVTENVLRLKQLNRLLEPKIEVVCVPSISGLGASIRNRPVVRQIMIELIKNHDVVVARMPTHLGLLGVRCAYKLCKPVVIDLAACAYDDLCAHGSLQARLYAPFFRALTQKAVASSSWVMYVTQSYLQERYPPALGATTIACSNVDLPKQDPAVLQTRLVKIANHENTLVFGTIGSLHGRFKGIQHALAALAKVKDQLPPFEYRVLGGGDPAPWQEIAFSHGLADVVRFDGTLPAGKPVLDWLDNIDVYLHPSLREGVPRAVIEAMSRGCPVIASNVAGTPELLPEEVMHDPGDVDRLARLLLKSSDCNVQRRVAQANFWKASEYSLDKLNKHRDQFWGEFVSALNK